MLTKIHDHDRVAGANKLSTILRERQTRQNQTPRLHETCSAFLALHALNEVRLLGLASSSGGVLVTSGKVNRQPFALESKTLRLSIHCGTFLAACTYRRTSTTFDQDDGAGAAQRRSPHQPKVSRLPLTHVFCFTSVQRHLSSSAVFVFTLLPFQFEAPHPTLCRSSLP